MNKYTVVVYKKTTVELYANSESETEEMAMEEVIESGIIDSVSANVSLSYEQQLKSVERSALFPHLQSADRILDDPG